MFRTEVGSGDRHNRVTPTVDVLLAQRPGKERTDVRYKCFPYVPPLPDAQGANEDLEVSDTSISLDEFSRLIFILRYDEGTKSAVVSATERKLTTNQIDVRVTLILACCCGAL